MRSSSSSPTSFVLLELIGLLLVSASPQQPRSAMFNFDIAAARPPAVTSPHPPAMPPGYRNARPPAVKAIAAGLPTVALGSGDHPIAATEEETNQRLLMFQEDMPNGHSYRVPTGRVPEDRLAHYQLPKPKNRSPSRSYEPYGYGKTSLSGAGGYSSGGGYSGGYGGGYHPAAFAAVTNDGQEREFIAGVPDMSDPCFRRYANCIIVNAQPYERRSSTALAQCKAHCLQSQVGVYSCRSFVYDNVNQVCDLFAHVGDQAPARLLKFQTRDYFEPTMSIPCASLGRMDAAAAAAAAAQSAFRPFSTPPTPAAVAFSPTQFTIFRTTSTTERPTTTTTTPRTTTTTTERATTTTTSTTTARTTTTTTEKAADKFFNSVTDDLNETPDESSNALSADQVQSSSLSSCESGQTTRYLHTQGFHLDSYDDSRMTGVSLDRCLTACTNNQFQGVNGEPIDCHSFDFSGDSCNLTAEAGVPVGNGQLVANEASHYYEKICVSDEATIGCPSVFNRFPQMILVGFAETVVDAKTFDECFDQCLKSQKTYGFPCSSGMYYFEEPQLNCILNSEDKSTQPDLFTEENTDIVDYFETGCKTDKPTQPHTSSNNNPQQQKENNRPHKHHASSNKAFGIKNEVMSELIESPNDDSTRPRTEGDTTSLSPLVNSADSQYGPWSECVNGMRQRKRICVGGRACGKEVQGCTGNDLTDLDFGDNDVPSSSSTLDDLNFLHPDDLVGGSTSRCGEGDCCPVFGGCRIGIRRDSRSKRVHWCTDPCT